MFDLKLVKAHPHTMPTGHRGPRSLAFRSFTFDPDGAVLFTHDLTGRRQPAYTVQKPKFSRHHASVSRIAGQSWNPHTTEIGSFKIHSLSSKIDLDLHGHTSQIRRGGKWHITRHTFEWPPLGTLEWREEQSGRGLHLIDEGGRTLARCLSKCTSTGEQTGKIEILVPGDDKFVDMCVVTSLAKWRNQEIATQVAMTG